MERRKEHAHITLDPHKIHRLYVIPLPQLEVQEHGGGQHGLLVREREPEEGGARFVFDFEFSFRRFGKVIGHLFVLTIRPPFPFW